jgi:hypothetical protein
MFSIAFSNQLEPIELDVISFVRLLNGRSGDSGNIKKLNMATIAD